MKSTDFRPVTSAKPCAICGKSDWCRRSDDGCHECHRSPETDPPGFRFLKTTQGGFGLYRRIGDEQCQSNHVRHDDGLPKLYASPDDAVAAMLVWPKLRGAREAGSWTYLKADGDVALKVVRFERDDGSKEFRPMRPVGDKWAIGGPPGKLPMYRLPEVLEAKQRGKTIHVVEGEGCADALWSIGVPATTSAHGCKSAGNTDWTPLAGANVIILPDNDPPGETYAEAVATLVSSLQPRAAVRIVRLSDLPEKGDIVDHIARLDSRDDADIVRGIEEMAAAVEPFAPSTNIVPFTETRQDSGPLANFELIGGAGDKPKPVPIGIDTIIDNTHRKTDGWPKACGGALFVPAQDDINWMTTPARLFGFLHHVGGVNWREGTGYATKGEFFAELLRQAESFDSVERYPHEPPLPNTYYMQRPEVRAPGDALEGLVSRFCPASDADRELIKAAFITPMHGGQPGTSPAFAIDSNDGDGGRGVGKTTLATMIGELYGGAFQFGSREDRTQMLKRLLTPGARTIRIAIIDNAKGRLSGEDIEALITARTLSGYANYIGEATRPNNIIWFVTANGLELSKDLAQRVVCINLAAPVYDATWRDGTLLLIDNRRDEIFADIRELLRSEASSLRRFTRWASWEAAVLAKLYSPEELQGVIEERSAAADTELDEWHTVLDFFQFKLREAGHENVNARISSGMASKWYIEASGENIKAQTASRRLHRLCKGKQELQPDPSRTYGRCFLYFAPGGSVDNPPVMFTEDHGSILADFCGSEKRD